MHGSYEGDLIRPLGLMTLYAAYAEGEIDELLSALLPAKLFDAQKLEWPLGRKLSYSLKLVRQLKSDQLAGLTSILKEAQTLFSKRNTLVHSQIFAGGRVVSNRLAMTIQKVTPEEIVQLAELLFACKEQLWMHRCKHLVPMLETPSGQNDAKKQKESASHLTKSMRS